jgi:hypothetical protein
MRWHDMVRAQRRDHDGVALLLHVHSLNRYRTLGLSLT